MRRGQYTCGRSTAKRSREGDACSVLIPNLRVVNGNSKNAKGWREKALTSLIIKQSAPPAAAGWRLMCTRRRCALHAWLLLLAPMPATYAAAPCGVLGAEDCSSSAAAMPAAPPQPSEDAKCGEWALVSSTVDAAETVHARAIACYVC